MGYRGCDRGFGASVGRASTSTAPAWIAALVGVAGLTFRCHDNQWRTVCLCPELRCALAPLPSLDAAQKGTRVTPILIAVAGARTSKRARRPPEPFVAETSKAFNERQVDCILVFFMLVNFMLSLVSRQVGGGRDWRPT